MEEQNTRGENKVVVSVNTAPETATAPVENKKRKNDSLRMFLFGIAGFLAVAFVALVVFGTVQTYVQAATDPATIFVAKVLRLPILKVNGARVLYSDYAADLNAIRQLMIYEKNNGGETRLSEEELSDQVLSRLVNNVLLKDLARRYGVEAEQKDIDELKGQIVTQFQDSAALEKELMDRYGWTLDVYTQKVIAPYVLESKLGEKIASDETAREEVRKRAEEVLQKIKDGADFAALAKQYGEDGTAANGGDLSWFGKGQMVPEFENAAFALKKGEITQTLVETQFGYHIIKVEDTRITKTKDEKGKSVDNPEVQARHILFMFPALSQTMQKAIADMDLHLYASVHDPFAKDDVAATPEEPAASTEEQTTNTEEPAAN